MRAFVRLRELIAGNKELAKRLDELEARIERKLSTHDQAIAGILNAIRQLMTPLGKEYSGCFMTPPNRSLKRDAANFAPQ